MAGGGENKSSGFEHLFGGGIVLVIIAVAIWLRMRGLVVFPLFALDTLFYEAYYLLGRLSPAQMQDRAYVLGVLGHTVPVKTVTLSYLGLIQADVGYLARWPALGVTALAIVIVQVKMQAGDMFRRRFSFRGFKWVKDKKKGWVKKPDGRSFLHDQATAPDWRIAITSTAFEPERDDPAWRLALKPPEFAYKAGVSRVESADAMAKLEAAFTKQLGKPWKGIRKAPPHARAIAVLAYFSRTRDPRMIKVAGDLAALCLPHQPFPKKQVMQLVDPLFTPEMIKSIDEIGAKHAFLVPAMIGIVGWGHPMRDWGGGKSGAFPPVTYLWLKGVDRGLWYALNNIGRKTFHAEALGAVCHFKRERMACKPLRSPSVQAAVRGLMADLRKTVADDIQEHLKILEEALGTPWPVNEEGALAT